MVEIDPQDLIYMREALLLAKKAALQNEVPVGAVLVHENKIIARGFNQPILRHDPTAHAEIIALRSAGEYLKNYRFLNTTLYVTLEPCAMCVGAILHARIQRLVFGANDPKTGAVVSIAKLLDLPNLNHRINYIGGVFAQESQDLLQSFFLTRR